MLIFQVKMKVLMIKRLTKIFVLMSFFFPFDGQSVGRKYEPEEGTFDRRKRIVIEKKCRLVKQTIIPGDVVCEYQSQDRNEKNRQIYLGAPNQFCLREITCPKK